MFTGYVPSRHHDPRLTDLQATSCTMAVLWFVLSLSEDGRSFDPNVATKKYIYEHISDGCACEHTGLLLFMPSHSLVVSCGSHTVLATNSVETTSCGRRW